jgi:hypothetical protein
MDQPQARRTVDLYILTNMFGVNERVREITAKVKGIRSGEKSVIDLRLIYWNYYSDNNTLQTLLYNILFMLLHGNR